jgi:hypothetical protein
LPEKEQLDNAVSSRLPSHAAVNYPLILIEIFADRPERKPIVNVVGPRFGGKSVLPIA